jgi:hypothetical protein
MCEIELIKAIAPAAAALIAVSVGIWQYRHAKREEFRKRFWEEQYELYSRAVDAAATIAGAASLGAAQQAREEFWHLYWGSLAMIEDHQVESAMKKFGKKLGECEKSGRLPEAVPSGDIPTELRVAAYHLAHSMRESLAKTWQPIDLGRLGG